MKIGIPFVMFENRYTVVHDQHGPVRGMVIGKLLSSGERFVGPFEKNPYFIRHA